MNLCDYKDIFGKPGEGIHSYRIYNVAVVDLGLTVLVSYFISKVTDYSFLVILLVLLILGVIFHRLFCVKTTVDNALFS